MAGRTIVARRSTVSDDPSRRLDEMENVVSGIRDDVENAFDVGGKWELVKATSNIVLRPWQFALLNPTAAAFGVLLPDPTKCSLARMLLKNDSASTNAITVTVPNSGTIDGATSLTMNAARLAKQLVSDGREWKVI